MEADDKKPLFAVGNGKSHMHAIPEGMRVLVVSEDIAIDQVQSFAMRERAKGNVVLIDSMSFLQESMIEKPRSFDPRLLTLRIGHLEHDLMESVKLEDLRAHDRGPKRGAFDRTGESPAKTLGKKRKWWER